MKHFLLLLLSAVFLAMDFSLNKVYQRRAGAAAPAALFFSAGNALFTAIAFFLIKGFTEGFSFEITPYSLLLAAAMSLCILLYNVLGFSMLANGKIAQYSLFLMIGGMTVPYVWGILALDEVISVFRVLGLILIFGGVFFANYQKEKETNIKFLLMGVAVFFLNGLVSIFSKMHQIEAVHSTVSSASFVLLAGLCRFIFCTASLLLIKHKKQQPLRLPKPFLSVGPIMLCSAVIGGLSYLLQLIGAQNLPATVLYPCINGSSIIFTALAALLFFREKITRSMALGILLCFAGMCCFL